MTALLNGLDPVLAAKFEQYLLFDHDEILHSHWHSFKIALIRSSVTKDKAYELFSTALHINQYVANQTPLLKNLWIEILEKHAFTVERKIGNISPSIAYNFNTLVRLAKSNAEKFTVSIVPVDPEKDDIPQIAKSFDRISREAVDFGFGPETYEKMITDPRSITLLAKCDNEIIACLSGTYVEFESKDGQPTHVLHFWFLGRKPDYPSINFVQLLQEHSACIKQKFPHMHYMTFCVFEDNTHALSTYEKLGVTFLEKIENGIVAGVPILAFCKKLCEGDAPELCYADVRKAVNQRRMETVGYMPAPVEQKNPAP